MEQFDLLIQQLTLRLETCAEPKIPFTEGYKMAIEHALELAKIYRGLAHIDAKMQALEIA
jgi:hypothetical protein